MQYTLHLRAYYQYVYHWLVFSSCSFPLYYILHAQNFVFAPKICFSAVTIFSSTSTHIATFYVLRHTEHFIPFDIAHYRIVVYHRRRHQPCRHEHQHDFLHHRVALPSSPLLQHLLAL